MELIEKLVQYATLVSFVFSLAAGMLAFYITVRLAPIVRRLALLAKELGQMNDRLKAAEDGVKTEAEKREEADRGVAESCSEVINDATEGLAGQISRIRDALPNCVAHRAELRGEMSTLKAEVRSELANRVGDIAEANRKWREEMLQRNYDSRDQITRDITREIITRDAVEHIVEKESREIERRHLAAIYERLQKLESKR